MPKKNHIIPSDVKQEILEKIKNEGTSVSKLAESHGISDRTIYGWLRKSVSAPPTIREVARLRKENQGLHELIGRLTVKLSVAEKKDGGIRT